MHASFSLVLAALAGSALAMPMIGNSTTTSSTSLSSSSAPVSSSSTSHWCGLGTAADGKCNPSATSSIVSSSSHWRPSSNSTTTSPPTSKPTSQATSTSTTVITKVTSTTVTWTQTDTIIKTSFIPTSTPAATSAGSTYYSTWLTTKVWTTTSCYKTSAVETIQTFTPSPSTPTATWGPASHCPAPTTTVTIIETVTTAPAGAYYPPGKCETCQTITYTDIWGYVVTIAVPTNPWTPSTSAHTSSASSTTSSTTTSTHASSSSSFYCGFGTGLGGKCASSTTSASSSSSTPTKGTGSYAHKPTAYPTNVW